MARFEPADHSRGDVNTIGGYAAVHDRPAAFEGRDGFSYSVELVVDTGERPGEWAGFLLFVRWARIGAQSPEGHLETEYLVRDESQERARERLGALSLNDVRLLLDDLIKARSGGESRRWLSARSDEKDTLE